ncbi:DNA internalization-related competence protein ComEC/Rec2 [Legionella worsleiensis]|uniref:DNA uptake/competence protein ComA n=2 Tax=Legionella worsleiensis TaxID=45076 RepID=A0A0W1A341_9GAMM|nr:DNA uptake/competence protein ComA [Legionella worsleiensis]STY32808.1 DNA uptake/competence protein ComA [Legionella worsleiensis]
MGILYWYTFNHCLPALTLIIFFIVPRYPIFLLFCAGMLVALTHYWMIAPVGMPDAEVIPNAVIQGRIASVPVKSADKTKFHFNIERINSLPAKGLIQLSWYHKAPDLHVGQVWQLAVKLKKPRNYRNPGSSNYVQTLSARHIDWTGYIRNGNNALIKEQSPVTWLQIRERLGNALTQKAPDKRTAGILEALTLNLTTHVGQEEWELFRRTGTTHLFGISGEHIALVSGLVFFIVRTLWSLSVRCCLLAPALSIAGVAGFGMALFYSFLAGFEPPVQRALIGCFFYTLYCLGIHRYTIWQIWRYALFGVLCLEPHAVFMQGFYFSFLAVACLLLTQQRFGLKGIKGNLALQLSCLVGLMPLTLYWYSYGSINGFIANLFAIPLVGFLIVPLALIMLIVSSSSWSGLLMYPLSWLVSLLFHLLSWTEQLAGINIIWSLNSIISVLSLMAALLIWIILPIKPLKYLAIIWILYPFVPYKESIKQGEALIRILDVGQGLAVAIQTQNHIALYDTGDQFFQGSDLGKMVVLPFLNDVGIKNIDAIVISHPDRDHLGGLDSIEQEIKVEQLIVNDPQFYHRGLNCHDYPEWEWDKVRFRFFPIHDDFNDKNNNSCILQVSTSTSSILFTGDIEKTAEDYLVRTYGEELASDVLVVPHHGSKTSSSYRFLLETAPLYAIASLGFANRFHFPHNRTLDNMKSLHIPFYRTDECGMVQIKLPSHGILKKPSCYSGIK